MNEFFALYFKELKSYFYSPIAYIFLTVFLLAVMGVFFWFFFLIGQLEMRFFFIILRGGDLLPGALLLLIPSLTMRTWSEEYKQGTIELLKTSSASSFQILWAKFLSTFSFVVLALFLTGILPLTLMFLGDVDMGSIFSGYIGACLLASAYIAFGMFMSSLTHNQIIAFILSFIGLYVLTLLGDTLVTFFLPSSIATLFQYIGLGANYDSIARGVLDFSDIFYFLSFTGVLLYANYEVLARK
jgi:ABC-2 type transport system permease protein